MKTRVKVFEYVNEEGVSTLHYYPQVKGILPFVWYYVDSVFPDEYTWGVTINEHVESRCRCFTAEDALKALSKYEKAKSNPKPYHKFKEIIKP